MIYAGAITAMTASTVFAGFSRPFVCVGQYGIAIGFLQEKGENEQRGTRAHDVVPPYAILQRFQPLR